MRDEDRWMSVISKFLSGCDNMEARVKRKELYSAIREGLRESKEFSRNEKSKTHRISSNF